MRYLYLLKDPITKEVVWVGETSKPAQRYGQHCWGTKSDSKQKSEWLIDLKLLGIKPLFEIVAAAEDKREALISENNLIVNYLKKGCHLFNIKNSTTIKQYNLMGLLVGEYCDSKMAKDITGIRPRFDRHTCHNFQWSYGEFKPELIQIKESAKKFLNKPVIQIDKTGKIINEFDGVRIAGRQTGIDHRSIQSVAAGTNPKRHKAGGFVWKYKQVE